MVESGIAKGDGYSFGANIPITRERLAVMYYNYAQMKGYDTSVRGDLNQYKDAAGVSSWARDALAWAAGVGLINGAPDGLGNVYFLGQGSATRAELAAITQRFCEKVAK